MALPRASRRKAIVISDEDEDSGSQALPSDPSEDGDEEPFKPQKRGSGKLKPVKKSGKASSSTLTKSTQNGSSQKPSPAKSKVTKAKSKSAAKDPLPNGRSILSFFNAATQRQGSSQPSLSPEKPSTPREEPETIHDDSGDETGAGVNLAKGSSTALAMRKRKVQHGESFESESGLPASASQKFRKVSSGDRVSAMSVINDDKRPWTEQFAPKDLSELAVHKRKVSDVHQWLEMAFNGRRQKVLVLKGAAGTGKTTTMKLLGDEMKFTISEWRNPSGTVFASENSVSAAQQFEDFVARSGRSGGLQFGTSDDREFHMDDDTGQSDEQKLLLVEEFPNTFSRASSTLQSFRSALLQYLASPQLPESATPTPIVLIVSETLLSTNTALADSFTAHRLLGPELNNHPYLDTIEFNAVAPTFLTKALDSIIVKEARKSGRRRAPGPQVLKQLASSGDVRSAVSSLEFLCLRGDDGELWSSKVSFSKQKKSKAEAPLTKAEEDALRLISNRESTLGIFHAVGKVVYNKRAETSSSAHPPPWFPQHRRHKVPENDVDELIDELGTDTSTFVAALHENYALSCTSPGSEETLDSLLGCVNSISDADLLSVDRFSFGTRAFSGSATDSLRQDEMSFQVAVRGLLFDLPNPVHRSVATDGRKADAHRMFYPASLRLWRKREEIDGLLDVLTAKFQSGRVQGSYEVPAKKNTTSDEGVESWKSKANFEDDSAVETNLLSTGSAKKEMLIERLPYMAQIMRSRSESNKLTEQITTVTRVRGSAPVPEDEEADADEEAEATTQEQWTTDRPEGDASIKSPLKTKGIKSKDKSGSRPTKPTEGGGLAIPVETRVEKLVLEDDDIED